MKIICPDCQKENNIVVTGGTKCRHCQKPLDNYKFIKPLIPAIIIVALTLGGSRTYDHFTDENRYPAKIEFALIDQCISSYDSPISFNTLNNKRDACISALECAQEEISYSEFKDDQKKFMEVFMEKAVYSH